LGGQMTTYNIHAIFDDFVSRNCLIIENNLVSVPCHDAHLLIRL
jgi:hypothetical protein